jgi:hypothetical protein
VPERLPHLRLKPVKADSSLASGSTARFKKKPGGPMLNGPPVIFETDEIPTLQKSEGSG